MTDQELIEFIKKLLKLLKLDGNISNYIFSLRPDGSIYLKDATSNKEFNIFANSDGTYKVDTMGNTFIVPKGFSSDTSVPSTPSVPTSSSPISQPAVPPTPSENVPSTPEAPVVTTRPDVQQPAPEPAPSVSTPSAPSAPTTSTPVTQPMAPAQNVVVPPTPTTQPEVEGRITIEKKENVVPPTPTTQPEVEGKITIEKEENVVPPTPTTQPEVEGRITIPTEPKVVPPTPTTQPEVEGRITIPTEPNVVPPTPTTQPEVGDIVTIPTEQKISSMTDKPEKLANKSIYGMAIDPVGDGDFANGLGGGGGGGNPSSMPNSNIEIDNGDSQTFVYEDFYNAYKSVQKLTESFNQTIPGLSISSDGLEGLDVSAIDGSNPCLKKSCGINNNLNSLVNTFEAINKTVIENDAAAKQYFDEHEKLDMDIENFAEEMDSKLDGEFSEDQTQEEKEITEAEKEKYNENVKNGFKLFLSDKKHTMGELADAKLAAQYGYKTPQEMYDAMLAVVISESNKTPDEVLAITSVLLNRCDMYDNWAEDKGTRNPFDQLFATRENGAVEFEAITSGGGRYKDYIPSQREGGINDINADLANIGSEYSYDDLKSAFDDAYFGGLRNNIYSCYWSGWTENQSIRPEYNETGGNNMFFNQIGNPSELNKLKSEAQKLGIKTFQI